MGNVKTVSVSAETAVKFDSFYPFVWIKNTGDTIAYASAFSGIEAGAENVTAIPAGESVMITAETDTVYVLSTGTTAEVHGQGYAESPFLDNYSEGSGTSITVESLSVTENGTYTAQTGKAYSPVIVNVHDGKYDLLYGNWYGYTTGSSSIGTKRLVKPITEYDDIIIWTSFLFQGHEWTNFMRYPASEIAGKNYNAVAYGGNYVTGSISADGIEITDTGREYQAIVAVYGIEVNNMERTTIFENAGSTNPATYPLPTGKTFSDYDEFIIIGEKDNFVYASYVPTSEIYVNNTYFGISIGSTGKTMYFSDNSTITDDATQNILVKKIIGVKYGA